MRRVTRRRPAEKRPKVVSLVGARPQFIKLAPLAPVLGKKFRHVIVHSGQHYDFDLSGTFFAQLRIPAADVNLGVGSGDHGRQTGRIIERFERFLATAKADLVLVYGDTNTTLAGALAAAKKSIPVAHVEAGLRSFKITMPEEINRRVTDHLSQLLFYPTKTARDNLRREGIDRGLVYSGDVMYELLDACLSGAKGKITRRKKFGLETGQYYLVTLHRAENADHPERLNKFLQILRLLNYPTLFLVHPRTEKNLRRFHLWESLKAIPELTILPPQSYLDTLFLLSECRAVLTDSGGLQKEAFFLGRPCLTMRAETEWVETVKAGANFLVDLSPEKVRRILASRPRPRVRRNYKIAGRKPSEIIGRAIASYLDGR